MKARVTITRVASTAGEGHISISIEDANSGIRVISLDMEFGKFAEAITGLGYCEADYNYMPNQFTIDNIGKKRETKAIYVEKSRAYEKEKRKSEILEQVENSGELIEGWMLHDDGTRSQQNEEKHRVNLYRFV